MDIPTVNEVVLVGRLAADPDIRTTKTGKELVCFPLTTNRKASKDIAVADYHRVMLKTNKAKAKKLGNRLVKGSLVKINGSIINRSFDDKEGNRHFRTEIEASLIDVVEIVERTNVFTNLYR